MDTDESPELPKQGNVSGAIESTEYPEGDNDGRHDAPTDSQDVAPCGSELSCLFQDKEGQGGGKGQSKSEIASDDVEDEIHPGGARPTGEYATDSVAPPCGRDGNEKFEEGENTRANSPSTQIHQSKAAASKVPTIEGTKTDWFPSSSERCHETADKKKNVIRFK
ncbi:hypothetical protein MRX96_013335 [Rhipicephalus microplus]